ncbi:hypothetical protein FO488_12805 [Geobacter sp. FeAm09]|uniref:helix-turn-helix domain-containing protein n=1 Tax=Geobacter sp. FeAm09 TaxID=2597769 RepID=UPI0011EE2C9D|nr:helix-turn-helix domain-containing protein [Geobacter sp. FeAm09]QEM68948.1 hypothetical protein FO488_12805 [Geobacter sp. FeAm09]
MPLASYFLDKTLGNEKHPISGFSKEAADHLLRYHWPGNVRELQNAVNYAAIMCRKNEINYGDLPGEVKCRLLLKPAVTANTVRPLAEIERDYIQDVLRLFGGNRAMAVRQLGIGTATLQRKICKYNSTTDASSMSSRS